MVGDFYRYTAENSHAETHADAKLKAHEAYSRAWEISLGPCHLVRLGLALNFSVFYYEVMGDVVKAVEMAAHAANAAADQLGELTEEEFRCVRKVLTVLRDNLIAWKDMSNGFN